MLKTMNQSFLNGVVSTAVSKKNIYGAVLCVEKGDNSLPLVSSAGNLTADKPYFIASVTKLYVTAVLLKLKSENRLHLQNKISKYLSNDVLHELHLLKGIDYSKEITIKHLMSNTSGIPDYFSSDVIAALTAGKDQSWGFEKTITSAKQKKPKFPPGKRAQYSDTNYQLLGKIIETITEKDIHTVFKEFIFDELKLEETYLFDDVNDTRPAPFFFKDREIHLPKYMSSIGPEGGIVSTAKESMIFLKAFINGHFFPKEYFNELKKWKILFGPGLFFYGVGIASQPISLKEVKGGLIGHWGQTGAFSFYHPKTDLYFTGTINQFYGHSVAAKMMIKIIKMYK
ncbi:serine hydrolase domain-containing protein [Alteribacillus sp. JSM 102045]|uniref:serine hydrolase domain-containing protein n=1 Tax=Alteribacillus sp. JSM 102045 TaxID=1562101 RepID=UPI0035BFA2F7